MPKGEDDQPRTRRSLKLHKELTSEEIRKFGASGVHALFKRFNRGINEIWEDYITTRFYLNEAHRSIKGGTGPKVLLAKLVADSQPEELSSSVIFGIIDRIKRTSSGYHAFIDSIAQFEHLMSSLTFKVYMDFPGRLRGLAKDSDEEISGKYGKVISLIIESTDRYEMLQKLAEEKVRGIFYGNPLSLFTADKAQLGFGNYFKENHQGALQVFRESTARRNIIIHNQAMIDRKYISESGATDLKLGQKVQIEETYLRPCVLALKELAAAAANCVATSVYKEPLHGKAIQVGRAAAKANLSAERAAPRSSKP